jgi:hypothetical protein
MIAPNLIPPSFMADTGRNPLGTASGNVIYEDLWSSTPSHAFAYDGYFTLDLSGENPSLTFTPVPEPPATSLALVTGLALLCLVRRFKHRTA